MRTKLLLAGLAATALLAGHASAAVVLSDNFNGEVPPPDVLNWPGDSVFLSTGAPGSVDLIGAGGVFDFLPGNGGYVDLDGSSGSGHDPAGQLTSVLSFGPGSYTLSFDLAGNQRAATPQSTTVSLGNFNATFGPLASGVGFTTHTITFSTTGGNLVFTQNGPSDQQGNLLDNISLASVPEPATWAMMLLGFGGLGAALRQRRRVAAASA
jgi:hypothetical protein